MTKLINKNLKIALIAIFALTLFAVANFSVCENANANGLSKNVPYEDEDGLFERDNIPEILLDADHNPSKYDIADGESVDWKEYTFKHRTMIWKNDDNHPWADADFYFGPDLDYWTGNLEFGFAEYVDNGYQDDATESFFVHYDKDCPASFDTQHYKIEITLYHNVDGGKSWKIYDTFSDFADGIKNSEILERAGHSDNTKKYGPKLSDILAEVTPQGKDNYKFYDALNDGIIKAKVTSISMDWE